MLEVVEEAGLKIYFFNDKVIALERNKIISTFRVDNNKASDILNDILNPLGYGHYIKGKVNYIVNDKYKSSFKMSDEFKLRIA